jgi:hypothetical protein
MRSPFLTTCFAWSCLYYTPYSSNELRQKLSYYLEGAAVNKERMETHQFALTYIIMAQSISYTLLSVKDQTLVGSFHATFAEQVFHFLQSEAHASLDGTQGNVPTLSYFSMGIAAEVS